MAQFLDDVFAEFFFGEFWDANLNKYVSNEKRAPGWLGYIGDEILPSYIGIIS